MKTNLLRHLAVAAGIGVCAVTQAQTSAYQAPAKWSKFNNSGPSVTFRTVASPLLDDAAQAAKAAAKAADKAEDAAPQLPIPAFVPAEQALDLDGSHVPQPMPEPMHSASAAGSGSRQKVCCARPTNGPISPWFAGADILFLTLAGDSARPLIVDDANGVPYLSTGHVGDHSATGFDAHFGRYFGCGRGALDIGYLYFNPGEQSLIATPAVAAGWRAAMPAWRDIDIDLGGPDSLWNVFDNNAVAYRARRDLFFQGIEVNWAGFGLMGGRRVGVCGPCGPLAAMTNLGHHGFYGGACGPMARGCSGCVQVVTSQGFRWFQFEDEFELAGDINGATGYQADDLYYNVETENNLFGYQLGSRVTYCVGPRLNIGLGGKIGLYGNHARYRQRIGTDAALAYATTSGDNVSTSDSDTFVSALGELDLGLGLRVSNAWTVRGGYRLLSACGVATATGSIADQYSNLAGSTRVSADDCVILHGGYVGLEFNW